MPIKQMKEGFYMNSKNILSLYEHLLIQLKSIQVSAHGADNLIVLCLCPYKRLLMKKE